MDLNKSNIKKILGILLGAIFFAWALQHTDEVSDALGWFYSLVSPFVLGAIIAFIVNVPMGSVERLVFGRTAKLQKARRPISYLITLILVFGILTLALYVIIPQLADTMVSLANEIPAAFNNVQTFINDKMHYWTWFKGFADDISFDWQGLAGNVTATLQGWASGLIDSGVGAISGIINGTVTFLIGFIFSIYLILQKEKLACQGKQVIYAIFPEKVADRIMYILVLSNSTFSHFLSGQCLEACIIGVLFFVVMMIFQMPYALLISVLIALCALIPIVGAFIGCIVGALLILMISPFKALMFIIMFLVLQQVEGNLIYPHVVGGSIGLPSLWVLVAVTVGANLMGVMGMLIFIPICSVCYALFRVYVKDKLAEKAVPSEKWNESFQLPPEE